jgi:hypothetical protein
MEAKGMKLGRLGVGAALLFILATVANVQQSQGAEETTRSDAAKIGQNDWEFFGEVYLWLPVLSGDTTTGGQIELTASDLFSNLNVGGMTVFAARRDKWTLFTDAIYLNLDFNDRTTTNIVGQPVSADAKVDLQGIIATFGGGYAFLETESTRLDAVAGVRYLWLDTKLRLDIGNQRIRASDEGHNFDGVIGLRGQTELNEDWFLSFFADVGTGDSDLTWQAWATVNYRFERFNLSLGYRYLSWNFDDDLIGLNDLKVHGPLIGAKFRF